MSCLSWCHALRRSIAGRPTLRHLGLVRAGGPLIAALAVCLLGQAPASADVIVLQSVQDNTLIQVASADVQQFSNGIGPNLFVGRNNQALGLAFRRGLILFDVSSAVPAGSVVTSASLTMQATISPGLEDTVRLHRLQSPWGEGPSFATGGQGAPAQPPDATWFYSLYPSSFWSSPGGDFVATASASTLVSAVGLYGWSTTPSLVADVQSWLDDPSGDFGWMLLGGETQAGNVHAFATREGVPGTSPPRLTIEFAPGVPEPGSLVLLATGGLVLLLALRRRPDRGTWPRRRRP